MAIQMYQGSLPHIFWIDLRQDGTFTECAVMKRDKLGNVFYFPLTAIDDIDKKRLHKIVTNRNAVHFELWDLMSNITLNNGVNALSYFHQLVRVMTPAGQSRRPQEGVVGINARDGTIDTRSADSRQMMEAAASVAAHAAAEAAAHAAAAAVRGSTFTPQPSQTGARNVAKGTDGRFKKKAESGEADAAS